jgi:hypothetical protein
MPDTSRTPIAFVACLLATGVATAVDTPPVSGHYEEANTGSFDIVDGLAYSTSNGATVVHVVSKPIASAALGATSCPMTEARSLALLRNASFLEVTLDSDAASQYFASGSPYGGQGREEEVGGHYWTVTGGKIADSRISGGLAYGDRGGFDFDLPVMKPSETEVSESDRVGGNTFDGTRRKPTEPELLTVYEKVRFAAIAKDLGALLAAQGFTAAQSEAVKALPGIQGDLAAYAARFLAPGKPEEPMVDAGTAFLGAKGKNSAGAAFTNYYEFHPCGDRLVLVRIVENPQ